MYSQGVSHSPVDTKSKNSETQCKLTEALPCEKRGRDSIGCVPTKRSRDPSPVKIQIKLGESDEECDLVIDTPSEPASKKRRSKSHMGRNRGEELAAVDCAEELGDGALPDVPKHIEEMPEEIVILRKNSRSLSTVKTLDSGSKRGDKIYLPDVNTDKLEALEEIDTLNHGEKKHVSLSASVMGTMKRGFWKRENVVTKTVVKAIVPKSANEDSESSRRVTQSVLCTGDSSKDEATTERPYIKIKTEEGQRIEENRGGDSLGDTHVTPIHSSCKKESKITLSLPTKELQSSGDSTEASESDDLLEECLRIFEEFEKEKQMEACDQQAHRGKVLGTEGGVPEQKTSAAYGANLAIFEVCNKNAVASLKASPEQKSDTEIQQEHQEFVDATKERQAFIDRTSEEKQITPGLSATQYESTETKVQPIKMRSGHLYVLLTGNASTSMPCGYSIRPLKRPTGVPGKAMIEEQSVFDSCSSRMLHLSHAMRSRIQLRECGGDLYELLNDYILTKGQLNENNFPRPNPKKSGSAILAKVVEGPAQDALKRVCCRCGTVYAVSSFGEHKLKEECHYHSGRVVERKVPGGMEKHYTCCGRSFGSAGCQGAKLHVHNGGSQKLEGFVKTLAKSLPRDGTFGVYALDCEMCYTTHGLELTRVTVVDAMLQVVYDTFVKPAGKIVDYDRRLSGVTEDDLKNTTTSLKNVQAALLTLFNADTILIGHKLEKSFIALKLIHDTVVDTSVVFPHFFGLPKKRTPQNLAAEYLKRIHQDDAVNGHNSKEEATACMKLILWKIKKDNKKLNGVCDYGFRETN